MKVGESIVWEIGGETSIVWEISFADMTMQLRLFSAVASMTSSPFICKKCCVFSICIGIT